MHEHDHPQDRDGRRRRPRPGLRDRCDVDHRRRRLAWPWRLGRPVAAGIIGGLALGAIAAQAAQPSYYTPPVRYYDPQPRYYEQPAYYPVAEPQAYCHVDRRPAYNAYGDFIGWRPVRVCN